VSGARNPPDPLIRELHRSPPTSGSLGPVPTPRVVAVRSPPGDRTFTTG